MTIPERVRKLVQIYETRDPLDILDKTGAIIVMCPLEGTRGFYQYYKRNNIVYIDDSLDSHDASLVCAHELGHMILHKNINAIFMDTHTYFNTQKYEIEANAFAMELLIPDELILENTYLSTDQLSRLLGYSEELVKLRLKSYFSF